MQLRNLYPRKCEKSREKPQKMGQNRRIQLKYRECGVGNTFIRFPNLEYGILKKKIIILDLIEKKLVAPPTALAAILNFGPQGQVLHKSSWGPPDSCFHMCP